MSLANELSDWRIISLLWSFGKYEFKAQSDSKVWALYLNLKDKNKVLSILL
jgi:hypothetical protein